jgi:hypothetical protein
MLVGGVNFLLRAVISEEVWVENQISSEVRLKGVNE